MHHLKTIQEYGQSIWLDFISRDLITGGRLKELVADGLRGMTSNPSIFQKSIAQSGDYDEDLRAFLKTQPGAGAVAAYEHLAVKDIQMAADALRPVYDGSDGLDGCISLEVSPHLAADTAGTIAEARRLWQLVDRPNLMIKVPATPEGMPAIEELLAGGVNVNVTLIFSLKHYESVARAYMNGVARNPQPQRISSVASFFVSRVDTSVDKELEKIGTAAALALRGRAAVANAKLAYRRFRELFYGDRFAAQRERGARVQRVLWGSTSTKNPDYPDLLYVDELIGADTVNTLPMETLEAYLDHGRLDATLEEGTDEAESVLHEIAGLGINLDDVTDRLQKDGVQAFVDAFDGLLAALSEKIKS